MSTQIVQVVSRTNGELKSLKVKASPYEFTMATRAKWEMVVSDEDVGVREGEFKKINQTARRGGSPHFYIDTNIHMNYAHNNNKKKGRTKWVPNPLLQQR